MVVIMMESINYFISQVSCKHVNVNTQVLGGTATARGQFPFAAFIQVNFVGFGGSLIHGQWVLTSGFVGGQ